MAQGAAMCSSCTIAVAPQPNPARRGGKQGRDAMLSIIIPARNDADALRRTLDHLAALAWTDSVEVIVAASGDVGVRRQPSEIAPH